MEAIRTMTTWHAVLACFGLSSTGTLALQLTAKDRPQWPQVVGACLWSGIAAIGVLFTWLYHYPKDADFYFPMAVSAFAGCGIVNVVDIVVAWVKVSKGGELNLKKPTDEK